MADTSSVVVPHNIEAEQAVLGAIFIDPACLSEVALIIKAPEMFYRASHQHIYRAIQDLSARGAEIDWVHVTEGVRKQGALEACGGAEMLNAYLSEISHAVPSSYGAEGYASIVRDRFVMREIVHTSGEIRSMALEETRTPGEVIEQLERKVFELAAARYHGETHNFLALLNDVIKQQQLMTTLHAARPGLARSGRGVLHYSSSSAISGRWSDMRVQIRPCGTWAFSGRRPRT